MACSFVSELSFLSNSNLKCTLNSSIPNQNHCPGEDHLTSQGLYCLGKDSGFWFSGGFFFKMTSVTRQEPPAFNHLLNVFP